MRLEVEFTATSIHTGVGRVSGPIEMSRHLEIKQGKIGGKILQPFCPLISDLLPVSPIGQNWFKIRKQEGLGSAGPGQRMSPRA